MTLDAFFEYAQLDEAGREAIAQTLIEEPVAARQFADAMAHRIDMPEEFKEENERVHRIRLAGMFLAVPDAQKNYAERNFPGELFIEGLPDVGIWARHCVKSTGHVGLFHGYGFIYSHFEAHVLQFGRLQCNDRYAFQSQASFRCADGSELQKGDPVIALHIPESGPLDIDACRNSMKRMEEFFARCQPDYAWKGFFCHSWLLDPELTRILPPESNIVRFQRLGQVVRDETVSDAVFRVFGHQAVINGLDSVPHVTRMQKTLAAHLDAGNVLRYGTLFIPRGC